MLKKMRGGHDGPGMVTCRIGSEKASFYLSAPRPSSRGHLMVQDGYWSASYYSSIPSPARTDDGRKDKRGELPG